MACSLHFQGFITSTPSAGVFQMRKFLDENGIEIMLDIPDTHIALKAWSQVDTGQISAAETGYVSGGAARQTRPLPGSKSDICSVAKANICLATAADIYPV